MRIVCFLLVLFCLQEAAQAHTLGTSYSFWTITGEGAEVHARVSQLELTRLQLHPVQTVDYPAAVANRLATDLQMWSGNQPCEASTPTVSASNDGWLSAHWRVACEGTSSLAIRSQLLHSIAPSHLHFVKVTMPDGGTRERVLTYAEPVLPLAAEARPASRSLLHYLALGVEHILSGWDHLAFVLGLILLAGSLREMAIIATGFTLAHSLTLGLAVLGLVHTRMEVVEALIGFSIALVAAENLWKRAGQAAWLPWALLLSLLGLALSGITLLPTMVLLGLALFCGCHFALLTESTHPARLRAALAVVFGLVHGFGFAGVMEELQLPAGQLAVALFGFNSGVELGQLLVIGLLWPMLRFVGRWPAQRLWVNDIGATVICALGTYWFVLRGFG